jgi:4-amino-4-deoxy-L-arabinose transferase-like glycosyltransferase
MSAPLPMRRLAAPTWALLGLGLSLHLALASALRLSPDEAHYGLYGAHPDWSYFDHPPLVGWLQWPFVLAGGSDLLMRVVPMAMWLLAALLAVAACRILPFTGTPHSTEDAGRESAAVALLLLTPLLNLIGVALVPDTVLMPLVLGAMLATWRLREARLALRTTRWVPLALVLGTAVLAKYTGVFIAAAALACLWRFHRRAVLHFRGFWLVVRAIALATLPILAWNAAHDWASIAFQTHHAIGDHAWTPANALRAIVQQLAMYGLLLPVAVGVALRRPSAANDGPVAGTRIDTRDARFLALAFGLPLLATAMGLAGGGTSLPHWTACGWCALVPLAAAGVIRLGTLARRTLVGWQLLTIGLLAVTLASGGFDAETGAAATSGAGERPASKRPNPVADLFGWDDAAAHAVQLARETGASSLVVGNWSLASRLAWYARPWPVHVVPDHVDQFRLWFGAPGRGSGAIVVDTSQMSYAPPVGPMQFERCRPLDQMPVDHAGRQVSHFTFLWCEGWRSQQGRRPLGAPLPPPRR